MSEKLLEASQHSTLLIHRAINPFKNFRLLLMINLLFSWVIDISTRDLIDHIELVTNKDNLNTIYELCSHPSQAVLSASGRINIKSVTFQS